MVANEDEVHACILPECAQFGKTVSGVDLNDFSAATIFAKDELWGGCCGGGCDTGCCPCRNHSCDQFIGPTMAVG